MFVVFVGIWKFTDVEWNALCELLAILCANTSFYTHFMKLRCQRILSEIPTLAGGKDVTNTIRTLREDAGVQDENVELNEDPRSEIIAANSQAEGELTEEDDDVLSEIAQGQGVEMMIKTIGGKPSDEEASSPETTPRLVAAEHGIPQLEAHPHSNSVKIDDEELASIVNNAMDSNFDRAGVSKIDGLTQEEREVQEMIRVNNGH